jgi:hypothetical protein
MIYVYKSSGSTKMSPSSHKKVLVHFDVDITIENRYTSDFVGM